MQVTKAAIEKGEKFPFVTVDMFEVVGSQARKLSGVDQIIWSPKVDVDQFDAWTTYSNENIGWYNASIVQFNAAPEGSEDGEEGEGEEDDRRLNSYDLSDMNYEISSPGAESVGPGPWAPIWQVSPPPSASFVINLDMYVYGMRALDEAVDKFRMGLMTQAIAAPGEENVPPRSVVVEPVFEYLFGVETAPIVGHIYSLFSWDHYLKGLLPKGVSGIVAILKNSCGESFTYSLNGTSVRILMKITAIGN